MNYPLWRLRYMHKLVELGIAPRAAENDAAKWTNESIDLLSAEEPETVAEHVHERQLQGEAA